MKDDPKYNILFVRTVEQFPVIYNNSLKEYASKDDQESAWAEIARRLNESMTNCKEKWKNLRSCLCRHVRNLQTSSPGAKNKKSYYLAEYMEFLIPYIKSRPQNGSFPYSMVTTVMDPDQQGSEMDDEEQQQYEGIPDEEDFTIPQVEIKTPPPSLSGTEPLFVQRPSTSPVHMPPARKRRRPDAYSLDYMSQRPQYEQPPVEDPDLCFFKSLLPEMRKMDSQQKNKLKILIINTMDEMLYSSTKVSNPYSGCHSSSDPGPPTTPSSLEHPTPSASPHINQSQGASPSVKDEVDIHNHSFE